MEQIKERLFQYQEGMISAREFAGYIISEVGLMWEDNDEQAIYDLSAVLFRGIGDE